MTKVPGKKVFLWNSHRFWAAVSAAGAGLATAASTVAAINPIAGVVCKLVGVVCTVIGGIGVVWFTKTSDRVITLKRSEATTT